MLNRAPGQRLEQQTLGPFFPDPGDPVEIIRESGQDDVPIILANDWDLTQVKGFHQQAEGQVIELTGQVKDKNHKPLAGCPLLLWQASASGRYNHKRDTSHTAFTDPRGRTVERTLDKGFQYWGHSITDARGGYRFRTIVPGYYPADLKAGWFRPPHLHFIVVTPDNKEWVTQTYFRGPDLNDNDWIQRLNARDYVLRDPGLAPKEQENLIIDYEKIDGIFQGQHDFVLPWVI